MLIGLCGPVCAGRTTIAKYLVNEHGFNYIANSTVFAELAKSPEVCSNDGHPLPSKSILTQCWKSNINVVICNVAPGHSILPQLLRRPYFLLVYVDAPMHLRFNRRQKLPDDDLPTAWMRFVVCDDIDRYGSETITDDEHSDMTVESPYGNSSVPQFGRNPEMWLTSLEPKAHLRIVNDYSDLSLLHAALRSLDLTDKRRLRPSWDMYFMSLARLASERTNCMKRRVGCVISRDRRMIASGYNGTPSRVTNCNDGGCPRCNDGEGAGKALDLCLCLHAEENAIIEAGRDRCQGSTLYASLYPCILCAKKIVQAGIARVVYDCHYASDENSEKLMKAGGVIVEKFAAMDS